MFYGLSTCLSFSCQALLAYVKQEQWINTLYHLALAEGKRHDHTSGFSFL